MLRAKTPRVSLFAAFTTLAAPSAAYTVLPPPWSNGYSWLEKALLRYAPRDPTWKALPTGCMGQPVAEPSEKLYQILIDIGQGEFLFLLLMSLLISVNFASAAVAISRHRNPSALPIWTSGTAILVFFGFTTFARAAVLAQ